MKVFVRSGLFLLSAACASTGGISGNSEAARCSNNGGVTVPTGFCASVFADSLGKARYLAIAPNGDIYVADTINAVLHKFVKK